MRNYRQKCHPICFHEYLMALEILSLREDRKFFRCIFIKMSSKRRTENGWFYLRRPPVGIYDK
jgi:hypothetical protein